jgi:uncharacterized DUF497 family protein
MHPLRTANVLVRPDDSPTEDTRVSAIIQQVDINERSYYCRYIPAVTFDWDEENVRHIDDHDVLPDEVEDAFADPDRIPATAHRGPRGQPRRAFIGATDEGRVLTVVYEGRGQMLRVVTARDATDREYQQYTDRLR